MKGTVHRLEVQDSLRARVAALGRGVGSGCEEERARVRLVANRFPPPVSSPAESGGECWPGGPNGAGWVPLAAGSFVVCLDTGPAPAASAEDMASPGLGLHMCSAYALPPCPTDILTRKGHHLVRRAQLPSSQQRTPHPVDT